MRRFSLIAALLSGCFLHHTHVAVDGAVLGRVVVYRNGVAYYERDATIDNGKLAVRVPRNRVDDFLKSLTVVDRFTKKPLSVTIPRKEDEGGDYLTMTLETPEQQHADVLLTYVTEAPAWKPTYRVVVGDNGHVMLEGWAIVDNMSGEDWKGVLVGVGASSALSFRYDLWSVRNIDRDLLEGTDTFASAPPTGISPYVQGAGGEEVVDLDAGEIIPAAGSQTDSTGVAFSGGSSLENQYVVDGVSAKGTTFANTASGGVRGVVTDKKTGEKLPGVTVVATSPALAQTQTAITDEQGFYKIDGLPPGKYAVSFYYADVTIEQRGVQVALNKESNVYQRIDQGALAKGETIQITAKAPMIDTTSTNQSITIDKQSLKSVPVPGRTFDAALGAAAGAQSDDFGGFNHTSVGGYGNYDTPKPAPKIDPDAKLRGLVGKIVDAKREVVIETHATTAADAQARANALRTKLVDQGVAATKIHIVEKVGSDETGHVRVLAVAPGAKVEPTGPVLRAQGGPDTPVGESHFMSERPMTVKSGSSAMVALVHDETPGGVVYLYDPVSDRGDKRFAFKAVRVQNPTADTLEAGPVTVFGDGRFVGEGLTEQVPPKASVVVPFALDRQIVVETAGADNERIAKLVTAERGVITAELQHRRATTFTITSRLTEPTKVFVRHRVEKGWTLVAAPAESLRVGDSQLFEVDVGAGETKYVTIAETTPLERSLELGSNEALDMMKVYIDEPDASPQLKAQVEAVIATHRSAAELVDRIQTVRDELLDYRAREGELHAQIVSLKLVRTSGDLMASLHGKLVDTSERIQKLTLALVDDQEQLMLMRIKFQNQLTELHLENPQTAATTSSTTRSPAKH